VNPDWEVASRGTGSKEASIATGEQPPVGEPAVRLENLSKQFGAGNAAAVDGLSLDIKQGEIFGLLGPSGCGKTTTLRLIAGLESPDRGAIYFDGRPVVSVRERIFVSAHKRNVGLVFQSYAIWPHMTVFDNVAYPLKARKVRGPEIRERVSRMLDLVGLPGLERRPAMQLSGGQQQRVALARAVIHEPNLLLLDEPFSNLDAKLREHTRLQLKLLLKRLRITAVFVTHDQVEALSLSDRVAIMQDGRVEQLGSPKVLYEQSATPFVRDFLGTTVLLRARIDGDADGDFLPLCLETIPGARLIASTNDSTTNTPGDVVQVAIRPEDIRVLGADEPVEANCLMGTLEVMLFVGDHFECRVRVSSSDALVVPLPRSTKYAEGQSVRVLVPPEALTVWPA
jgi:ABC-type Fe3+/spermidine/putrescine transport system ATPase subunit